MMCDDTRRLLCLWPFMILLSAAAFLSPIACEPRYMNLQQPNQQHQPTTTSVVEGKSVILKCQATILEGLEYSWTHNGHPIQNTSRVFQHGPNLSINYLNKTLDAGDYECIATSTISGAREISPKSTLNIIWIKNASVLRHQTLSGKHKNDLILKCIVEGSSPVTIEWYKNAEIMEQKANLIIDELARKLIITQLSTDDGGVYQCSAKNEAGIVFSQQNYELKPKDYSIVDHSLGTILINTDSKPAHLRCAYRQSKDIERNLKNNLQNIDDSIEIYKNLRHDGKGLYLCRGKRGEKVQEFNSELAIGPPSNIVKPTMIKMLVNENDAVVLNCESTKGIKKNPVIVKWKKDDKFFKQIDINSPTISPTDIIINSSMLREDGRIATNRKNGSLIISSVILSDVGLYECVAFNEQDTPISTRKTELKVIEQLKFVPPPTSKNLELGTVGKVHCKVQGTPTPQIKWIKQNLGDSLPDTVEDINGTLVFKNVTIETKGNYTCIASNSQGTINATVYINSVVAPRFIIAPEGVIHAQEMGTTMVHCQATGDPKPTVQWDKDLHYISNNSSESPRIHILENGTLHILEVHLDDEGRYGCTIGSSAGLKREEARLTVKAADEFAGEESSDGFMITRAVLITMTVAFAYIILVVGLMLWCRYRRQVRKARLSLTDKETAENGNAEIKMGEIEPCLPDKTKSKKMNGSAKGDVSQKSDDTAASTNSKVSKKSSNFDQIALARTCLFEMVQIGRGDFGDVFIGKIKSGDLKTIEGDEATKMLSENEKRKSKTSLDEINEIKEESGDNDEYKQVLIKALNKSKDEHVCIEFRRQIEMFRAISHRSVAKLYGLCRDKDPHYLVLEYSDWGDLKQFLLATNNTVCNGAVAKSNATPLITSQILAIAHQIARGMDSIYRARYIHKDLAARNCIITSNFVVKVSYPALNRDKYSKEYYKHKNCMIPLRWLAPECLQDDDYSTKSDVYAFGVIVWELFTRAKSIPFEEMSNEEFLTNLKENKLKWQLAEETPTSLSTLMISCWNSNVKERPSFSQLYSALGKCLQNEKTADLKE